MQVTTSYKIKITNDNLFKDTLNIYRDALSYLINVVNLEWEKVVKIEYSKSQVMFIERLVHNTSKRTVLYDFDDRFYKFPSYLRRAAISEAIGKVLSFHTNYNHWFSSGQKGNPPVLRFKHFVYPVLFKDNMFIKIDNYTSRIKVYLNNDWVWREVSLRKSDADYILRHKAESSETVPTLQRIGKNWYLRFAFIDRVELVNNVKVITSVDLGINNAAVCSAVLPDGTVLRRKIISFPVEKDQIGHTLNKLKKAQQHGARHTPRLWAYVNNSNRALSEKTANAIMEFSSLNKTDVIVFEHLDMKGKKRGSKKQRLHLWKKQAVIAMVTTKAHLSGMRVSTVCAWKTSKLAFDGSGNVERDIDNYSMCTFTNGKRYHSDLNASYNIGARYYIREILKSLPETVRLAVEAKVPRLAKRTTCGLSDLISLNAELVRYAA